MLFQFPEETAGKVLYKNDLSDVEVKEYLPCDRELVVFSMLEPRQIPQSAQYEGTSSHIHKPIHECLKSDIIVKLGHYNIATELVVY